MCTARSPLEGATLIVRQSRLDEALGSCGLRTARSLSLTNAGEGP